ncbi:MAG: FKBP-type peptidyl-prolyl cis-trans isomerase [Bacteroidales bacterium]|nr:FKBP-type peptidyl-prolyl cis-trans isomerase [Bacteroidales bacterium]HOI31166.1 FKBP-type peptidyl-prolyl cis-trans isomerase [Bacteroidales bacterium]
MKSLRLFSVLMFGLILFVAACSNSKDQQFKTTESGLKYRFYEENKDESKPIENDIVQVEMKYTVDDSIIFDSEKLSKEMRFPLMKPVFPGDFYEGIAIMHRGDSASFLCPADRIFLEVFRVRELPEFVKPASIMRFDIRLINFMSPDEFEAEQHQKKMAQIEESDKLLQAFLEQENITVSPTESGLYYIEKERGNGVKPQKGQIVKVHYAGRLTNGLPFDDSYSKGKPFEFELGAGRVIKGWDEGIALMRKGGKAMLIIPQNLAYGERETGRIPAYSPLVFEVELVDIVK